MKYLIAFISGFLVLSESFAQDSLKLVIYFDFNSSKVTNIAHEKLRTISQIDSNSYSIEEILLFGHCDQIGSFTYNDSLSLQRVLATKKILADSFLIGENVIRFKYFGKRNLVNSDTIASSRQLNRRVDIIVVFKRKIVTTIKETPIIEYSTIEKSELTVIDKIRDTLVKVGDTLKLYDILFLPGRHQFLAISNTPLLNLFTVMKEIQSLEIEIHGHICCNTSIEDALDYETGKKDLSIQRAKAVYDYLVKKGINPKRMKYKGFGKQFPLNDEKTTYEMQRNRRVEIKIVNK